MQGVIIEIIANKYIVKAGVNEYTSTVRGRLKTEEISPSVGDKVIIEIIDNSKKLATINQVLSRNNYTKRPKLANIDQMVFVVSSQDPKPDLLMLDKQIAFAEFIGIEVLIIFNKIDLDTNLEYKSIKDIYEKVGYKVIVTNAKEGLGVNEVISQLSGKINAFSGNSGVGKSTLINAIFKVQLTLEGEISKKNKKGKNTTTAIKLYEIDEDTYIADTPGFSTLDISEIPSKELYKYYIDFRSVVCDYASCTHIKEEECKIKEAVEDGEIDKNRYLRFKKIFEELAKKEEKRW